MPNARRRTPNIADLAEAAYALALSELEISDVEVRVLLDRVRKLFVAALVAHGLDEDPVKKLAAKFRDAGRRSAPWRPASSIVPGRPQTGADGNRINRWLLPEAHKYYATEVNATLVEVKFFLQALSMDGAPNIPHEDFRTVWVPWLLDHPVVPNTYLEPIQLVHVDLTRVVSDRRIITSGHLIPLDRDGGRHVPSNAFLIFGRSNQMQGNMTLDELLTVAERLVARHKENGTFPAVPRTPPEGLIQGGEAAVEG